MKTICSALVAMTACLSGPIALAADVFTPLSGFNCFSVTPGLPAQVSQWGVNATTAAVDVVCPFTLADLNYTTATLYIYGYNRNSDDKLRCNIYSADFTGDPIFAATASLDKTQVAFQAVASPVLSIPGRAQRFFIACHLPAQTSTGLSHLTSLLVKMTVP